MENCNMISISFYFKIGLIFKGGEMLEQCWNQYLFAPKVEDRGTYFFCPVRHSVILSETLTLLITFKQ